MYTAKNRTGDAEKLRKRGGQWLKQLRLDAGLSQRQMSDVLGLEYYTFISQLETGRGRIPPDRYEDWARALKVNPRDFVRTLLRYYDPVTYRLLFKG